MKIMNSIDIFTDKKKVFFVGAMGAGKTEISINYAIQWARLLTGKVGLIDLDMVKPYFRLRSIAEKIGDHYVEMVIPRGKYSFADSPIIPPSMEAYVIDLKRPSVIDVGGDDVGARLVGRYSGTLKQDDIEFLYVYNGLRPFSGESGSVLEIMKAIENASKFKLTGLVHNSHLMTETTIETLEKKIKTAEEIALKMGIPVRFHCIREDLYDEASKKSGNISILPLKLYVTPQWL